jgi:hypothetical protein
LSERDHFLGIWRRALNLPESDMLTPALIGDWATERGLQVAHVEERDIGPFNPTKHSVLSNAA